MDDISRESPPDHPGQRVGRRGVRGKGPAEWSRLEEEDADDCLDRNRAGGIDQPEDDRGGHVMVLDAESGGGDGPDNQQSGSADEDIPIEDAPTAAVPDSALAPDQLDVDEVTVPPADDQLSRVLGALLLSSRESLTLLRLSQATNTTSKQVRAALATLSESLKAAGLALEISINGEQVRLLTTPDVFDYLRNLRAVKKRDRLSAAALETLAVVAYRQPVIRAGIEAIRGVQAGPILRTLLDHRLVKMVGRADVPGRPLQYGTTQHFLETFGLESLSDLPSVKEFRQL